MDPMIFLDLANELTKLKMYPYFDLAHFIVTGLYLRDDLSTAFAGNILSAFLLGEPIADSFKSTNHIILATAVWYILFYSPFDFVYKIIKFLPCKIGIVIMKEIVRCKKIHAGVQHAYALYPNSYLIMIIIGTVKGNGSSFSKILERCIRGVWTPTAVEFMSPSFATKASIGASVVFVLDKKTDWISAPPSLVYLGVVIFFIYFKLSSVLLGVHDPFLPFENLVCALCFGGIWDILSDFISAKTLSENGTLKTELSRNGKPEMNKKKD
ncbi:trimeric intracellular cation channel type A-like protein [Sarcoptes scabiei]|uniref:Trimeric intracellular cation channel type A-like protein n=1 Tax=Sarcoptes scabiei TaxID=52283 RepID=A0A131ZT35_SARSC|nr:trimeric intracellular cation channel type A-like protein [Sarcoptes scabiei]